MIPILRSHHVKLSFNGLLSFVIFMAGIAASGISFAQSGDPVISQEYFVQQAADEALLIMINAFEAEFESEISDQDGAPGVSMEVLFWSCRGSRLNAVSDSVVARVQVITL